MFPQGNRVYSNSIVREIKKIILEEFFGSQSYKENQVYSVAYRIQWAQNAKNIARTH